MPHKPGVYLFLEERFKDRGGYFTPASLALIALLFPQDKGKAIGIWSGIAGIGLLIGQGLGGVIISTLNWHWIFWINVPFFVVAFFMVWFFVEEANERLKAELDYPGFIFLTLSSTAFLVAILQGPAWHWLSPTILTLFLVSFVAFGLLLKNPFHHSEPLIDIYLFRNKDFFICSIAQFIFVFFNCAALFLIPLYLHYIHHDSAYWVGILMTPAPAMMVLVSPFAGKLLDKRGYRWPVLFGLFVMSFRL